MDNYVSGEVFIQNIFLLIRYISILNQYLLKSIEL